MKKVASLFLLVGAFMVLAPTAVQAKPPSKCAGLVETSGELAGLLDQFLDTTDEINTAIQDDPKLPALFADQARILADLGSLQRILESDLDACGGPTAKSTAGSASVDFVPAALQGKAPKKCAPLVKTTRELSGLVDDYIKTNDQFLAVPEGDPSEQALLDDLFDLEGDMRSIKRVLERDLKTCKGK